MNKSWILFRKEYRTVVKTKSFVVSTALTPLFMGVLVLLPAIIATHEGSSTTTINIVEVGGGVLRPLVDEMRSDTLPDGQARWAIDYRSVPAADTAAVLGPWRVAARERELDAFVVVDSAIWSGGEARYFSANVSNFRLIRSIERQLTGFVVRNRLADAGVDPARAERITASVPLATHKVGAGGISKAAFLAEYFAGLFFVMILFMLILGYGTQIMRSVIEEKNSRIIEVMISSVTPSQIMAGKILGLGSAGLTQVAIWMIAGGLLSLGGATTYLAGAQSAFTLSFAMWFTAFLILGYFLFSCWFALLGAVAPTEQDAQQFMFPAIMILIVPIILEFAIVKNPEALWVKVLSLLPPFSPTIMVLRMTFADVPWWEAVIAAVLLVGAIVAAVRIVARVFRVGILMTGKRPTLPEIVKWVKYG